MVKIRLGYVSNSSSSSFVINGYKLSSYQKMMIMNHIEVAKMLSNYLPEECDREDCECDRIIKHCEIPYEMSMYVVGGDRLDEGDAWDISNDCMSGSTIIDNFDMIKFLVEIGVPSHCIVKGDVD